MSVELSKFNASIAVTELLTKTLENCARELASRCIRECAERHGFNGDEEIKTLGLENLTLIRKQMAKKSGSKAKEAKKVRPTKEKKSTFPMPFIPENVDISGCQGLAYNRGLFTQCMKKSMENGIFCSGCQTESDKNASGCPDCGTVEARLNSGLYEFKDPKGRSPVSFVKVLEKLKLSQEEAKVEAGKKNLVIADEHFIVVTKVKKATLGRPKKAVGIVEADNVTDLFAKLTAEESEEEVVEEQEEKPKKKTKLSDEEKAVKKAALESERAAKKLEREAKIAEEKAEREEKRKAEAEQKKAEREAKIAEEKAEREAKRIAEKAERDAKKAAEKALKDAEKASKTKSKKTETKAVVAEKPVEKPAEKPVASQGKVSVSRIQISGKQYLKSSNNILYDPETKEELGLWDPVSKTIKELPEDDEEEVEEGYESN
jgi:chemotaxis protein histidine kinase CheA